MNVFDELIDELKEEHLIETSRGEFSDKKKPASDVPQSSAAQERVDTYSSADELSESEIRESELFLESLSADDYSPNVPETHDQSVPQAAAESDQIVLEIERNGEDLPKPPAKKRVLTAFEKFRKQLLEQIAALQMVDNIFSSVEREQIKTNPKPFDDLPIKKILHEFVKLPPSTDEAASADFHRRLLDEMNRWESALAARDQRISVENLRYCCENTRPPLSPPALLALAKFYRNARFSENNRNKFELIITRLFATDLESNKRELVFSREELEEHLSELYQEWKSSSAPEDADSSSKIQSLLEKFDDLLREAHSTDDFDDLIESEFFNRVRLLKRSTAELFYAPPIAATAIICNVRIGNRYVDLLRMGQERSIAETIEDKYSFIFDSTISEATNKSVEIAEIIRTIRENPGTAILEEKERVKGFSGAEPARKKEKSEKSRLSPLFGVNRWILFLTVLTIVLSAGLVLWVEVFSASPDRVSKVEKVEFDKTAYKSFFESGRITGDTLFVIATPEFDASALPKKEETLKKLLSEGEKKGYKKVHLLDSNSKTIGFATESAIELK